MAAEETVVSENGEGDCAGVFVYDGTGTASLIALGIRIWDVTDIQTLLGRFSGLIAYSR